ncbi:MAG: helix-turn-helix transcriptional regulator [Lactobacillales bacterium]|jgi:CBS domain-containing protein/biotin operon repressor|nr:helix-turn-helix transcriptional regulator [Lactobacillales bacterium]
MELTSRQLEIVDIVKESQPISGQNIAEKLNLSRATLRSDFSILTMLGILEARPKVGYLYSGELVDSIWYKQLYYKSIEDIMVPPLIIKKDVSIYEAVTMLFLYDIGSLYVGNEKNQLLGVISRKDLLRSTITNSNLKETPVAMIMTRASNVVTTTVNARIIDAGYLLMEHQVDSLPVISEENKIIGKVTKSRVMEYFIKNGLEME